MALAALTGPAANALQAYRVAQGNGAAGAGGVAEASSGHDFGAMVQSALQGVVGQGHAAEAQSTAAISGHGNLLDVVSAVSKAELSLQTTLAVRDRVVQAYQDIMRMPI
jgi:flagellar hook-basal body complex protein FliE